MPTQHLVGRDPDGLPATLDIADVYDYPNLGFGYNQPLPPSDYPAPVGSNFIRVDGNFSAVDTEEVQYNQSDVDGGYVLSNFSYKREQPISNPDSPYQCEVSLAFFLPALITGKFNVFVKVDAAGAITFEDTGGGAGYCQISPFPDDDSLVQVSVNVLVRSATVSNPFTATFHLVPADAPPEPTEFWTNLILAREVI